MQQTRLRPSGRYRETEVRALLEEYAAVVGERDTDTRGLRALVAVADVKRGWASLNSEERRVLLVMGVLGLNVREAAAALHKSTSWASRRYRDSLEALTWLMNGGTD